MSKRPLHILPLIVLSQFAGTSLWFVGNAILPDIEQQLRLGSNAIGNITSFVQFGFISGTLLFALCSVADRFSAPRVFFISCILAALANGCIAWFATGTSSLMLFRFGTGFFLAGIYPVGMKIAADWYKQGLGKALGWLVGALVLGTAFPYLLKGTLQHFNWRAVILCTSLFAAMGGGLIFLLVPDGPYRKKSQHFHPNQLLHIFRSRDFRSAAFGYFGHMWELYTFWAFVPVMIALNSGFTQTHINIPAWSFIIIGSGCASCIAGGYLSRWKGSATVAFGAMLLSGTCCLLSAFFLKSSVPVFLLCMLVWGISVVADSPQFSALVAQTAPGESKGTALTFVTSIGFAITIASIQFMSRMLNHSAVPFQLFMLLALGPILGLSAFYRLLRKKP